MIDKVKVGLIGSGFISAIHADALKQCADAELVAVASPSPGKAEGFARKHGIPHHFTDYRRLLEISLGKHCPRNRWQSLLSGNARNRRSRRQ